MLDESLLKREFGSLSSDLLKQLESHVMIRCNNDYEKIQLVKFVNWESYIHIK